MSSAKRYRVLKFGGTSVTGAAQIDVVARVVRERAGAAAPVLVVSAFAGVTDALRAAVVAAARGEWRPHLEQIIERHEALATDLLRLEMPKVLPRLAQYREELGRLLQGMELLGETSARTLDVVQSFGERMSAELIAEALTARGIRASACDARRLIVTDAHFGEAAVAWADTAVSVRRHFADAHEVQVVTGFIGATAQGDTTTLGRGGSDYTAAILGATLDAEAVEIWTDVEGVMSADPRIVRDAFLLRSLSYDELLELSHWGARVVHAPTVGPLRDRDVPLHIRNSLNPDDPGTLVSRGGGSGRRSPVRGIASVDRVALIQLQGIGLSVGSGLTSRLFDALARVRCKPLLLCQASSERSICVALHPDSLNAALNVIDEEFQLERRADVLDAPAIEEACSIITVIGEGMRERPGLAGRVFGVLGDRGINVRAIVQGSSELSISLVIDAADEATALRAIHDAFFSQQRRPIEVFLAGPGRVGSVLLDQITAAGSGSGVRVRVAGIARRGAVALSEDGIDPACWRDTLGLSAASLQELVDAAVNSRRHPRVFVDCTASPEPVAHYAELLRAGVALVTANKIGFSGSAADYERFCSADERGARCYHETAVGAGLPVLRTIEDLVATGDGISQVEGVLSGTLGYILDAIQRGTAFSAAVREAYDRGYTEPDPRQDLSGADVARKLLILGRVAGFDLEPADVQVEPLVPDWAGLSIDEFWQQLGTLDDDVAVRCEQTHAAGRRLVYLGRVDARGVSVRLEAIGSEHPCWSLRGTENLVSIVSDRYATLPLVVRGPGAGADVTAAGVFADILRARAQAGDRPLYAAPHTASDRRQSVKRSGEQATLLAHAVLGAAATATVSVRR
jgi:bifunctional aspartokinase / homoserine dehydrogenase 1